MPRREPDPPSKYGPAEPRRDQGPGYPATRTGPEGHDLAAQPHRNIDASNPDAVTAVNYRGPAGQAGPVVDGAARGLVPSAPEPAPRVAQQQRVEVNPSRDVSGRVANQPRIAEPPPVGDAQNVAECLKALSRITDAGSLGQIARTATARAEAAEETAKAKTAEKAEADRAAARAKKAE